jgi:hypothetical protein
MRQLKDLQELGGDTLYYKPIHNHLIMNIVLVFLYEFSLQGFS